MQQYIRTVLGQSIRNCVNAYNKLGFEVHVCHQLEGFTNYRTRSEKKTNDLKDKPAGARNYGTEKCTAQRHCRRRCRRTTKPDTKHASHFTEPRGSTTARYFLPLSTTLSQSRPSHPATHTRNVIVPSAPQSSKFSPSFGVSQQKNT